LGRSERRFDVHKIKKYLDDNLPSTTTLTPDGSLISVLHSERGSPHESFIIHAPYTQKNKRNHGLGLVLSTFELFAKQPYWSKDVMLLFTNDVHKVNLTHHANSIYAAITVEMESARPKEIEFAIVGYNGQLPNLDLRNVLERLMYYANEESAFPSVEHYYGKRPLRNVAPVGGMWKNRLVRPTSPMSDNAEELVYDAENAFDMVKKLAIGKADGHHGDFLLQRIEALTIRGIGRNGKHDFGMVGYLLEGVSRSVNNLLERFHQSFFYYLLPRSDRYMSNGDYFIPLVMLILIPVAFGVKFWFTETTTAPDFAHLPAYLLISSILALLSHLDIKLSLLAIPAPYLYRHLQKLSRADISHTSVKGLYCIAFANFMLCSALINFSLVFTAALILLPFFVLALDSPYGFYAEVNSIFLVALPTLAFSTFLSESKELSYRYNGDFLTYNFVVFFLVPSFTLLRFLI